MPHFAGGTECARPEGLTLRVFRLSRLLATWQIGGGVRVGLRPPPTLSRMLNCRVAASTIVEVSPTTASPIFDSIWFYRHASVS